MLFAFMSFSKPFLYSLPLYCFPSLHFPSFLITILKKDFLPKRENTHLKEGMKEIKNVTSSFDFF